MCHCRLETVENDCTHIKFAGFKHCRDAVRNTSCFMKCNAFFADANNNINCLVSKFTFHNIMRFASNKQDLNYFAICFKLMSHFPGLPDNRAVKPATQSPVCRKGNKQMRLIFAISSEQFRGAIDAAQRCCQRSKHSFHAFRKGTGCFS